MEERAPSGPGGPADLPDAPSGLLAGGGRRPPGSAGAGREGTLRPGAMVDRFELGRELGRGASSVVFEARDTRLGRPVAFKVVLEEERPHDERLLREAQAAARLSHPSLVAVHDAGRSAHGPWLALELLHGRTLAARLEQGRLSTREALRIGEEVAKGIACAHAAGLIHRHLQPGDVFLCDDGQVKVLGLGLARASGQRPAAGESRSYLAPEQWRGAPEDERSDVFALGVLLHRMLADELAFPEDGGRSAQGPGRAPALDVPELPALGALVSSMLEKDPVRRPRDAAAVLARLEPLRRELERSGAPAAAPAQARPRSGLAGLVAELHRRRVFRALVAYGTAALLLFRLAESLARAAALPGWVLDATLLSLGLGFPATVLLAWTFDLTGQGVRRTAAPPSGAAGLLRGRRLRLTLGALGLLAAAPGIAWWFGLRRPSAERAEASALPSIAVLPLANLSGDRQDEALVDGLHAELVTQLAKLAGLRVVSRTSVLQYRGTTRSLREVARELGAGSVLEGTVQKSGSRIRVAVQLVDARTDRETWAERYDRDVADLFAIQADVASEIVRALGARLSADERTRLVRRPTGEPRAYEAYLRALQLRGRSLWTLEDMQRSAALLRQAVDLDPRFALAHAWLAVAELDLAKTTDGAERDARLASGRREAELALSLDPELPEAEFALGAVAYGGTLDYAEALRHFQEAARRAPGDPNLVMWVGSAQRRLGRTEEAFAAFERARAADPGDVTTELQYTDTAQLLRRYPEAERGCARLERIGALDGTRPVVCALVQLNAHGDLAPTRALLSSPPERLAGAGPPLVLLGWLLQAEPARALGFLALPRFGDPFAESPYLPRDLLLGRAHAALADPRAAAELERARGLLEAAVRRLPDEPWRRVWLAEAEARVGRRDEALADVARAEEAAPFEKDAYQAQMVLIDAAAVHAAAGDGDGALARLDRLLSIPSHLSVAALRIDPRFASLRSTPGYAALLARYGGADQAAAAPGPGMALPLAALALGGAVGAAVLARRRARRRRSAGATPTSSALPPEPPTAPAVPSIAVLPFVDLSTSRDQDFFCDGIAEELLTALCALPGLRVVSRRSSFQFKGRDADAREVGQALGATTLLEGSVRKSGARVRISAQLVDAAGGYELWSQTFDRGLEDIFAVQEEIARAVAGAMRLRLASGGGGPLVRPGTRNLQAYELALHARQSVARLGVTRLRAARQMFKGAVELDPGFAQAHAGIADVSHILLEWNLEPPERIEAVRAEALAESEEALRLAPDLAEARLARANVLTNLGRTEEAERDYLRAIELNPGLGDSCYWYARMLFASGRPADAARMFQEAARRNPDDYAALCVSIGAWQRAGDEAGARRHAGAALDAVERRLRLDPLDDRALQLGATVGIQYGDRARALEWMERALELLPDDFPTLYNASCFYARAGDRERALELLDRAVATGRGFRRWIEQDPDLDAIRGDPRFAEILGRLKG